MIAQILLICFMLFKPLTTLFLGLNIVKMAISTISYKNIVKFPKLMLSISSNKFYKGLNIYIKIIFYLEIWNWKISCLMKKENLKLQILGFPNLKCQRKTSRIPTVEAHSTWHHKCLPSKYIIKLRCGHSFKVDYYALGILLYELLFGISPFYAPKK